MSVFRILSFEGGGVRGALSVCILGRLVKYYPELLTKTTLYTGTSTGSYISLCLANNLPLSTLENLYSVETSKHIFTLPRPSIIMPKYNNKNLKKVLSNTFPNNTTLEDLPNLVFIPSFNVKGYNNKQVVFFNNITPNETSKETVVNTALYSSAFPTVFPSCNSFIDGAIINNAPTVAPILFMRSISQNKYPISDFRLLSIGTGYYPTKINSNIKNWGTLQWGISPHKNTPLPLLDILLFAPLELNYQYSKELLKNNFFAINPLLQNPISMDSYKQIPLLYEIGNKLDLSDARRFIENYYLK
ncbi:MAG: hypothetical protein ATN36_02430 [Epulopiscium sp. Nele67-Bin005]|nr:MAG: hypothetical protein ATN36_02430 [Epulopiscium sp. Nele67-Bin005]